MTRQGYILRTSIKQEIAITHMAEDIIDWLGQTNDNFCHERFYKAANLVKLDGTSQLRIEGRF